jgi:hypothetical protein
VSPGDAIETGAGSGAIVVLGDSSVVMMQEKTRVEIPDVAENRDHTQKVRLSTGKVWFAVRKVQDRGKFEVETEEAVAAVRGTEFLVEVGEDGETAVTTADGEVAVTDAGRTRPFTAVPAGRRWALAARRQRMAAGGWRPAAAYDLRLAVSRWKAMLAEADRHWPHRRRGKQRFWQDRLGAPGPGAAPGARARRPGGGPPARPGPRRRMR